MALALFFLHYRMLNAELRAREQAEASLRTLSVRLLELQDQERRKFSRELHDSLGQYLVGVKMNLTMLGNSVPANTLIAECIKLLDQAMTETRTISHLLHPPLLDETGFASAARWYVEGFAKRSGIQTSLDMPEDLGRLPSSLELALFRVLQESLTNVHRHSKSKRADVSVRLSEDKVVLRVRDYGKGIPADVLGPRRFANDNSRYADGVGIGWNARAYPRTRRPAGNGFGQPRYPGHGHATALGTKEFPAEGVRGWIDLFGMKPVLAADSDHNFLLRSLDMPPAAGT